MAVPRTLAVIDIQNLFLSAREEFGVMARVDFVKLRQLFQEDPNIIVDPIAYVLSSPVHDGRDFSRFLKKQGYIIFNKNAQLNFDETDTPSNTRQRSWTEKMVFETLGLLPVYNRIFIVSGNGNFCPIVRECKRTDKKVTVVSFRSSLQRELAGEADNVIYLDKDFLYDSSAFKLKAQQEEPNEQLS